jgi:hypothetical protein
MRVQQGTAFYTCRSGGEEGPSTSRQGRSLLVSSIANSLFKALKTVYCMLSFLHLFLETLPVLFSPIFMSECIKIFFVPEMEVTEIILAKVLRLCQLSNHSHGFFKSRGPSLWFSFLPHSKKGKNVLKLGPKKYVLQ